MQHLIIFAAVAAVCASLEPDTSNEALLALAKEPKSSRLEHWRAVLNDICLLEAAIPRPANETHYYLECINLPEEQQRPDLGLWMLRKCKPGFEFVPVKRRCAGRSAIRRAQVSLCGAQTGGCQAVPVQAVPQQCGGAPGCGTVYQPDLMATVPGVPQPSGCSCPSQPCQQPPCPTQPQQCGCNQPTIVSPQPCPLVAQQGGVAQAQENGICSWMLDPLRAHQDPKFYLQCQPAPGNEFCGRWRKMCCAPATIFNEQLQVCTFDPNNQPGALGPAQQQCGCQTGQAIGQCGQNFQCPGESVCQVQQPQSQCPNTCCYMGAMLR